MPLTVTKWGAYWFRLVRTHILTYKKKNSCLEYLSFLVGYFSNISNIACVQGSTNGTNGVPISFKVLPMVPLVTMVSGESFALSTGYLPRGGLPRNSVDRLNDRSDLTSAVYRGRKASTQQQQHWLPIVPLGNPKQSHRKYQRYPL